MARTALAAALALAACNPPVAAPGSGSAGPGVEPTSLSAADLRRDAVRAPLATSVVDAYSNAPSADEGFAARWSPDGTRVLFASQRNNAPQIYAGDPSRPEAAATALTIGPERAPVAQYTRDGKSILFLRDTGADENFAIWRADADGSHATNLTPGEALHRGEPLLPRARGDTMLYSAARKTSPDVRLMRQPVAGGAATQVYIQHAPGALLDVTPDGTRALMAEFYADDDVRLTEIDVATGAAHRVFPSVGPSVGPSAGPPAGVYTAAYSASGASVYVATDSADGVVLRVVDAATGAARGEYRDKIRTSPLSVLASPRGDTVAIGVDAGTHGEVRILDAATLTVRHDVTAPLGEIWLGAFRDDGGAFSISISRPSQPDDPTR